MTRRRLSLTETEIVVGHLYGCLDACYAALGESAPLLDDDGTVVVVFEAARRIGERCLALREHLAHRANVDPLAPLVEIPEIGAALRSARDVDASGAFLLFCLSTVVVPKVLISLRDTGDLLDDEAGGPLREDLARTATTLVSVMREIGDFARTRPTPDVDGWREVAGQLESTFALAGYGESFGTGLAG